MTLILSVRTGILYHGDKSARINRGPAVTLLALLSECQPGYVTDSMASRVRGDVIAGNRGTGAEALRANIMIIRRSLRELGLSPECVMRVNSHTRWSGYRLVELTTLVDQYPLRDRACGFPVAGVFPDHLTLLSETHPIHT